MTDYGMVTLTIREPRAPQRHFPSSWQLSPAQDRILTRLVQKGQASKKVIAYLACPSGMGSLKAVKAQISYLRRALAKADAPVSINNVRGWGYQLDRRSKNFLSEFVAVEKREAGEGRVGVRTDKPHGAGMMRPPGSILVFLNTAS